MSAPLPSLLADKLDVSEEKAKKLLVAMLREVKKRAFREGVRLPELGTFREQNGQLSFEPSPSLARAVNQQFEGLESEDLGTAPKQESEEEDTSDGPDTITLGYQDSDWSPLDSEEEAADDADTDDDEADTAEFQVPAAEEAADTDELQAPDTGEVSSASEDENPVDQDYEDESQASEVSMESSADSPATDASFGEESSDEPDRSQTETEELYPLVEDVSEGSDAEEKEPPPDEQPRSAEEEERESLSDIWDSDDESDDSEGADEFELDSVLDSDSSPESEPVSETDPEPASEPSAASPDDQPTSEVNIESESRDATPPDASADADPTDTEEPAPTDEDRSSGARIFAGILVLLLLGAAGWYLLGERGTVQPPQKTFSQLKAQVQPYVENLSKEDLPLVGTSSTNSTTADASPDESPTDDAQSSQTETTSSSTAPSTSESAADASSSESDQASPSDASSAPSDETAPPSSQGIDASAGGYTVVVGSRSQRDAAESLLQTYRSEFSTPDISVGILPGEVNNETRYRIGVGQFGSQTEAQDFVEQASDKLPEGAWVLRL